MTELSAARPRRPDRAVKVAPVSQQQWGNPPQYAPPGTQPPAYRQNYPAQGFGPPSFGPGNPGFGGPQSAVPQYGPPGQMAATAKRSPLKALLLALIGVAVVAIGGLVAVGVLSNTSQVAYQNDDYTVPPPDTNPPAIPVPKTYEEAQQIVVASPFYNQTAPAPVRCAASPINVSSANDAQLKSHFEGMMECLIRVWQPPITQAGLVIVRPTVTIYGDKITTKCGSAEVNAFYCGADQQVYYSNRLANAIPIVKTDKWAADVVIAHEFGHAIQGRTGILVSAKALGQNSGDQATDLLYTRRLETQADCFSGMFIRSVSTALGVKNEDLPGIYGTYRAIGDDTLSGDPNIVSNHGLSRSRLFWGQTGLANGAIGKCNTFTAPASQVR